MTSARLPGSERDRTFHGGPSIHTRELALLDAFAQLMTSRSRVVAVVGPGGSGKSWFAKRFADRFAADFLGGIAFRSGAGSPDWDVPARDPRGPKLLVFDALRRTLAASSYRDRPSHRLRRQHARGGQTGRQDPADVRARDISGVLPFLFPCLSPWCAI